MKDMTIIDPDSRPSPARPSPARRFARLDGVPGGPFTVGQKCGLLAAFALLVALRIPRAWPHGRFLDEEGTIFFAYAWHRPALDALFRSFGGYLNLAANATTLLDVELVRGGILPLEFAPYLTMITALLFQCLPALLILTGRAGWLTRRWAVVAALLIVAIGPRTEEVFLDVLHIQFHLALCVALILALDSPRSWRARIGYGVILILAPLCGPGAIVLLPLFALRTLVDRDRVRLVQTAIFAIATAVQLLMFFTPSPVRGHFVGPFTLASIMIVRLGALPWFTSPLANKLGKLVYHAYVADGIVLWCVALLSLAYFGALIVLALRDRRDGAIWLILSGLAIGALSFGGGMIVSNAREWYSVGAGERYNFLPLCLVSFGIVALAVRPDARYRRVLLAYCTMFLVAAVVSYVHPLKELSHGSVWPDEVAAWRLDHDHPLATWPTDWTIDMSDHDRPCSPPRLADAGSSDPAYCESAWLARVARQMPAEDRARAQAPH